MVWIMHGPAARHATEYLAIPKAGLATWLHCYVALRAALALLKNKTYMWLRTLLCGLLALLKNINESLWGYTASYATRWIHN